MWGRRGGKEEGGDVHASSFAASARTCVCWFGKAAGEAVVGVEVCLGEGDCAGSETIAGTRIISSCSKVVASTTCSRDVCYGPTLRVKSLSGR
jgi:hypothetical protein